MPAIYHIGHHERGTTSFRSFFAEDPEPFLKAGVHYLWVESESPAKAAAKAIDEQGANDSISIHVDCCGLTEPQTLQQFIE